MPESADGSRPARPARPSALVARGRAVPARATGGAADGGSCRRDRRSGAGLFLLLWFVAGAALGGSSGTRVRCGPGSTGDRSSAPGCSVCSCSSSGVLVVRRLFRRTALPLQDVMDAADRVAGGDYDVRLPERGLGEVGGSRARSTR